MADAVDINPCYMQIMATDEVKFIIFLAICRHWYSIGCMPDVYDIDSSEA